MTAQEYLEIERRAEFKSEYFEGEMFAMAGGSKPHNIIVANVIRVLGNQLLERDCIVYPSDMRVKVDAINKYVYPDVAVACGETELEDEFEDTVLNPVLVFEVTSDSTEVYDRGKKFEHYQFVEALSEYVLIAQKAIWVEQYVRQSNRTWIRHEYHALDDVVKLQSINCELALKDIYFKVPKRAGVK